MKNEEAETPIGLRELLSDLRAATLWFPRNDCAREIVRRADNIDVSHRPDMGVRNNELDSPYIGASTTNCRSPRAKFAVAITYPMMDWRDRDRGMCADGIQSAKRHEPRPAITAENGAAVVAIDDTACSIRE